MKVLIIGGVAAGTKTAAKLKREDRSAKIVIYWGTNHGNCSNRRRIYWAGGS